MKPWVDRLQQHVAGWSARWPRDLARCIYHFTSLDNAVSILNGGEILSRSESERRGCRQTDSASRSVIAGTPSRYKDAVRLYFRPKTPTQYVNEGIRPSASLSAAHQGAHCPVPIFFAYDLVDVISRDGTYFSNGNVGSQSSELEVGDSLELFERIEFKYVYHNGPYTRGTAEAQKIHFSRQAEVLVPNALGVDRVQYIVCRSNAERRTLLHLLSEPARRRFESRVQVDPRRFFNLEWAFVENVAPVVRDVNIVLNCPRSGGPVDVNCNYNDGVFIHTWHGGWTERELPLTLTDAGPRGVLQLKLEGHLAYEAFVDFEEVPR